ncbi:MAG: DegT/DnrJ/EryC1/StrS family aminotransferase [Bacteroidetes bacterium]|nr:DegT/DnrJ/EryC1/StrS family aminotransferase [Bacteroidota bacterium]
MNNISFFGLDKYYSRHSKEILRITDECYSSGMFLMGKQVQLFEDKMKKLAGRKYAVAVGSCSDALYFALVSSGVKPGDHILITSFTYIASVTPIIRAGAVPVFVDIDPENYMMDPDDLRKKITGKTKAIIAVHLGGQCLPMAETEKIANEHGLILIEDAAQALGCTQSGRQAGNLGDISCFSFDPTKIIGAFGTGGIVATDDRSICETVTRLRFHGKNMETGAFETLGYNSQLATAQAALLDYQLGMMKEIITQRNKIAAFYYENLKQINGIRMRKLENGNNCTYSKCIIEADRRDELLVFLKSSGIPAMIHYPVPVFKQPVIKNHPHEAKRMKSVYDVCAKVLSLPVHTELTENEIIRICKTIAELYGFNSMISNNKF